MIRTTVRLARRFAIEYWRAAVYAAPIGVIVGCWLSPAWGLASFCAWAFAFCVRAAED